MGMRRLSLLLSLALLLAVPGSGHAGHPTEPPRITLGKTNVIVAHKSTRVAVRLPAAARVALLDETRRNPDASFSGLGRIVGVALVQDGQPTRYSPTGDEIDGPRYWFSSRWSWCGKPGCLSKRPRYLTSALYWDALDREGRITLPAGDYTLHVLTDGAPVRVRLTLHGLRGGTRLHPASPAKRVINQFGTTAAGGPVVSSGSVRNRVRLPDRGLLILGVHQQNPAGTAGGLSGFEHTVNRIDDDLGRLSNRDPSFDVEAGQDLGDEEWSFSVRPISAGEYLEQFAAFRAGGSTEAPTRAMSLWFSY